MTAVCISAGVTLVVGIVSLLVAHMANKRERRRVLYSEAVKTAVTWREMVYRVRRRGTGQERELIERFHALQDDLSYYQAWVGAESKAMSSSYERLIKAIKTKTEPLITAAWEADLRAAPGNARQTDQHPDLSEPLANFMRDVRGHLSPWPWRKLAVMLRN